MKGVVVRDTGGGGNEGISVWTNCIWGNVKGRLKEDFSYNIITVSDFLTLYIYNRSLVEKSRLIYQSIFQKKFLNNRNVKTLYY